MEEPVLPLVDLESFCLLMELKVSCTFFFPSHMVEQTLLTCSVNSALKFCHVIELSESTEFRFVK